MPEYVIPPPNMATPFENRELDTSPEASKMPRIAKVSVEDAKPAEMISCTRVEFELKID